MPELPEVENLRRGLQRALRGRRIKKVVVTKPKLVSGKGNVRVASTKKAAEFARKLAGDSVLAVERLAKNLIFKMKSGAVVVAHLKMSGQFAYKDGKKKALTGGHPIELSEHELPNKHTHIIFDLDRGALYYNDTRMFGYVLWYPSAAAARAAHFQELGVEPLGPAFTLKYFREGLAKSGVMLKTALMDQAIVNGLGNIYADEVCFAAGVRPDRRANTLIAVETQRLHVAIKRVLAQAIATGGSSVSTYRLLDMTRGNYAREHKVYGRAGRPCVKCGRPLSKMLIQSRTTVFCKNCQK
ncbi:MAG: DNA-formamidopyrimidine glycosylase [Candidatus Liptonbacteria bacterium RIFCSPHIGHO2_01_FULL_57_28]|uniref:Formamidopyrimidine-DNA glycosylase n=1 Tax=Candidatus Liptonbacteria bacterium RIFCSPHIGHO2_01_FULL_57_28 TaxID=1798647 RepID=A0A1G2CAD3_9BACT|nr:MAG: DNA-formamidopyrimidine glycosylase [Candidatus Liptonbacteria bacterium RIFCSPHIGHO2_01_FULL_57_28]